MTKDKMTADEFAEKVEEVGSLYKAIVEHGITYDDLDLSSVSDDLIGLVYKYTQVAREFDALETEVISSFYIEGICDVKTILHRRA